MGEEDEDEDEDWTGEPGGLVAYDTNRLESRGLERKRDRACVCSFCKMWSTSDSTGDATASVRVWLPQICEKAKDSSGVSFCSQCRRKEMEDKTYAIMFIGDDLGCKVKRHSRGDGGGR